MIRSNTYYNLHKHCYSVRQKGLGVDHADSVQMVDVRFNVAPAGREKVREEGKKNVHATVSGYRTWHCITGSGDGVPVTYNPMKYDQFVRCDTWEPVRRADYVELHPNRRIVAWGVR